MVEALVSIKDAADWASQYLGKCVSASNINYLIQYAKIHKKYDNNKNIVVDVNELKIYYDKNKVLEEKWKKNLGEDLNWNLSFNQLSESERTKHVHRLHPYKGKFIPQLVEYFLDSHINDFKKQSYFQVGDVILDPFMGSGTTLIQSSELGLHSIGIDVSEFNCLISQVKSNNYDIFELNYILTKAFKRTLKFSNEKFNDSYNIELKKRLNEFNKKYFPNPEFKYMLSEGKIDEKSYTIDKLNLFIEENKNFIEKNDVNDISNLLDENEMSLFLTKWFSHRIRQELFYYIKEIENVNDYSIKNLMKLILSRTARSCRATTHSDLATLKEPQIGPYYCVKHMKICTPIDSIIEHLEKNTEDAIQRIEDYSKLKKEVYIGIIHGDSRDVDILNKIKNQNINFYNYIKNRKIDGVFSSPPYVGQIDYHEQHAYAYELFQIERNDEKEIGPLFKGTGKRAKEEYIEGVTKVLLNINKFIKDDGNYFIVANDKYNLYPEIAQNSNLNIIQTYKRPVLNRTERDRQPYAEFIFHLKKC
jgi:DNA modification methylase